MSNNNINNPTDGLMYLTDCTLATVENMCISKSKHKNKSDFERQILIAQSGVDCIRNFGESFNGNSRIEDVVDNFSFSVEKWAESMIDKIAT